MKSRSIGIVMAVITVIVMLGHVAPASAETRANCGRTTWVAVGASSWDRTTPLLYSSGTLSRGEQIQFRSGHQITYTRQAYRDGRCTKQTARVGSANQWRIRDCRFSTCSYWPWQGYTKEMLNVCSMKVKPGILPDNSIRACDPISGQWRRVKLS